MTKSTYLRSCLTLGLTTTMVGFTLPTLAASGIYRDGAGGRAMALGGAEVGLPSQPLEALHANPAGLSLVSGPYLQLGMGGAFADGEFTSTYESDGSIKDGSGFWPEAAFAYPIKGTPLTLGLGVMPDAMLGAEWDYADTVGAGGAVYPGRKHKSEILSLRSAFGVSWAVTEKLSIGASLDLIYNDNTLQAPYIFQSTPGLVGAKTALDLNTDGFGVGGTFGLVYRPITNVSIGLSYRTPTRVNSEGSARGNLSAQLPALPDPTFRYDAEVVNNFPQQASAGLSWQMCPKWRSLFQVDWINWSDSFDDLAIHLTDGSNPNLPGGFNDSVPLKWRDSWVYRFGLEYQMTEQFTLRAGYAYGNSPVPNSTLLPLTAAIMEHKVTAGVGWSHGRYSVDAAYQYDLPSSQTVGTSGLAGGEYSNSRTEVSVHWFALTAGIKF